MGSEKVQEQGHTIYLCRRGDLGPFLDVLRWVSPSERRLVLLPLLSSPVGLSTGHGPGQESRNATSRLK